MARPSGVPLNHPFAFESKNQAKNQSFQNRKNLAKASQECSQKQQISNNEEGKDEDCHEEPKNDDESPEYDRASVSFGGDQDFVLVQPKNAQPAMVQNRQHLQMPGGINQGAFVVVSEVESILEGSKGTVQQDLDLLMFNK